MKKLILLLPILALLTVGLFFTYREMSRERELEKEIEAPVGAESRVKRLADGQRVITLDAATQKLIQLQCATPVAASLPREVKAYGWVLDPVPLAALLAEIASASNCVETSLKELERVRNLAQSQNTSARALDAAEAAMRRDRLALDAVQIKLAGAWGKAIAGHADLFGLARSLVSRETALVRLNLRAGETAGVPSGARLFTMTAPEKPLRAQCLGPAPDMDGLSQGVGYIFLAKDAEMDLRPGQALLGQIAQPGPPLAGVLVPPGAIVRALGKSWVYQKTSETNFARRDISLDQPAEGGWLVGGGITEKDLLVVSGAQMLFSEELKSRIPVGE